MEKRAASDSGLQSVDLDDLIAQLRARVDERRRAGEYPPGLEDDLSTHFRRILDQRHPVAPSEDLEGKLAAVRETLPLGPGRISFESELPGGRNLHRAVAKAVSRQTDGILRQVQDFAEPTTELLAAVVASLEWLQEQIDRRLAPQLGAVLERQAEQERRGERIITSEVSAYDAVPDIGDASGSEAILGLEDGRELVTLAACQPASLDRLAVRASAGGVTTDSIIDLVELAADKVRIGGQVLVEMGSSTAAAHPAAVSFLFSEAGFRKVEIKWAAAPDPDGTEGQLHRKLLAPPCYFVVAYR